MRAFLDSLTSSIVGSSCPPATCQCKLKRAFPHAPARLQRVVQAQVSVSHCALRRLPVQLEQLTQLARLTAKRASLSGTVPASISSLSSLRLC